MNLTKKIEKRGGGQKNIPITEKKKGGKEKKPLAVRLFTVSRCVFHVARVSFNNQTRAGRTMQFNAGDSAHRYRDETSRIPRRRRLPSNDNARIAQNAQLSKKHRAPTVFFLSLSLSLSRKRTKRSPLLFSRSKHRRNPPRARGFLSSFFPFSFFPLGGEK